MATLQLTDTEIAEIQVLIGNATAIRGLAPAEIRSGIILGAASDYVFERIRQSLNIEELPTEEAKTAARRFADDTDDDIANFIAIVLKPPQQQQIKRAVIYRCAGLCVPIVKEVTQETAAGIQQGLRSQSLDEKQENFFQRADEEILRLNKAFNSDAFSGSFAAKKARVTLFTATRS